MFHHKARGNLSKLHKFRRAGSEREIHNLDMQPCLSCGMI